MIINAKKVGGITPTGNINITSNGTYDVTEKATASVNVPMGGALPKGYMRAGYLESNSPANESHPWIDTEYLVTANSRIVVDFQYVAFRDTQGRPWWYYKNALFGAGTSGASTLYFTRKDSGEFVLYAVNGYSTEYIIATSDTDRHTIEINKGDVYFDGEFVLTISTWSNYTNNGIALALFAAANQDHGANAKIFSVQIYDDDDLARDFVPCATNQFVKGVYDTVQNKFYTTMSFRGEFGQDIGAESFAKLEKIYTNQTPPYIYKLLGEVGKFSNFSASQVPEIKIADTIREFYQAASSFHNNNTKITDEHGGTNFVGIKSLTSIGFNKCQTTGDYLFPELRSIMATTGPFDDCAATTVYMPKLTAVNQNAYLDFSASLQSAQIGSIGYGVIPVQARNSWFANASSPDFVAVYYVTGANVDSMLGYARTSNATATIIIKASEDTTYGGVSYAAGDTIVTDTPT